jgi:hypothetical protein
LRLIFRFTIAAFTIASAIAHAQVWVKPVAPGIVYRMEVDLAVPRIVHALRYSFGAPGTSLKTELAGGNVFGETPAKGRETVGDMAARTGAIAAVNGDYFPFTGDPLGAMVRDGQLLSSPGTRERAVIGWGQRSATIGIMSFKGLVEVNGSAFELKGVNEDCPDNEMVLNTEFAGFAVGKAPNVHAVIKMDSAEWSPNGTFLGELSYLFADNPKLPIQPGNAVLTAHGAKAEILKTWVPGQKITFKFESNGLDWTKVDQVMGGGPFLLRNGLVSVDAQRQGFNDAFSNKRHPRTAMGRTATGDLWIVVIDGRQKMSDGATLEEAAKVMARLGCVDAVNLDGGGSSAINVFGVTLNRPSDGKERPIANGIVLMGTKPELASVPLKVKAPEKLALGSPTVLSVTDDAGKAVPNSEVFWSAMGDAWIDQGGMARPLQKGKVEVAAYARGQVLRATIEVLEPEKPAVSNRKATTASRSKSTPTSRGKRGGRG